MSYSLNELHLESNSRTKINFNGGELSSDSGLILIKEFIHKLGIDTLLKNTFSTDTKLRYHTDDSNLLQRIYQQIAGYFQDDDADELAKDPIFTQLLGKDRLASQPTLSRFMNRLDDICLMQMEVIAEELRKRIYSIEQPEMMILDVDSTSFSTHGSQEGSSYNTHYNNVGYHPLLVFDGLSKDLLKAELRPGSTYTSTGTATFLYPLLLEFMDRYPETTLFLRGDSGFADVMLYEKLESNSVSYAIRMKESGRLRKAVEKETNVFLDSLKGNLIDYAVTYTEFLYQADSWLYPRRIACKIEKPYGNMIPSYTFIVTNMESTPMDILRFYSHRGTMENMIKESKLGFHMHAMPNHDFLTNQNRLQMSMLTYNIFNWFRRLVLPKHMKHLQIDTIRLKLIKIASKVINQARYKIFKLCSSCPYKDEFYQTLENIKRLNPLLE